VHRAIILIGQRVEHCLSLMRSPWAPNSFALETADSLPILSRSATHPSPMVVCWGRHSAEATSSSR
jgi:hypothetical protein